MEKKQEKRKQGRMLAATPLRPSSWMSTSPPNLKLHAGPIHVQAMVDRFVECAVNGQDGQVDKFVRSGIPINARHSVLGYTALHASTALKDPRIMQNLIRGGADLDITATVGCVARDRMAVVPSPPVRQAGSQWTSRHVKRPIAAWHAI